MFPQYLISLGDFLFVYVFPIYMTMMALAEKTNVKQMLSFWVLIAGLTALESTLPLARFVPLYKDMRFILLAYLIIPSLKGATVIYQHLCQEFEILMETRLAITLKKRLGNVLRPKAE